MTVSKTRLCMIGTQLSVAEMANREASSLGKGHDKADEFRASVACCRIYHD